MQRAIPPDPTAASPRETGISQHEAIGDLHLAADAFANALEAYRAALSETKSEALEERVRLLLRISEVEKLRGRLQESYADLEAGAWTDDTRMARANSIARVGWDLDDQAAPTTAGKTA